MPTLDAGKQLVSHLWVDQPDARSQLQRRVDGGEIDGADAERLRHFIDQGYLTLHLDLDDQFFGDFNATIDRLWDERPRDLAYGRPIGGRISFADVERTAHREIGYRLADLHGHSPEALDLYLHPEILRTVGLILGAQAIAFQSLYFEYGSQQSLHRDPMFVPASPPSHLLASWIALEDISDSCGPLLYVPGSHRLPWFEFKDDVVAMVEKDDAARSAWNDHLAKILDESDIEPRAFTCRRGDVFVWHAGLLHGGARVTDPLATRKSFVVHYTTAAGFGSRKARMKRRVVDDDGTERWQGVVGETRTQVRRDGAVGLQSPLVGVI